MKDTASVSIYFRVTGAALYDGGPGYLSVTYDGASGTADLDAFIRTSKEDTARILGVPVNQIEVISRAEYEENTEDDDSQPAYFDDGEEME